MDAALGHTPPLRVLGTDWPTPDGTCLRDYIHVIDLADAHARALDRIATATTREDLVVNLGAGRGESVKDVLAAVERAVGRPVPHDLAPRRDGDVAVLVADIEAARALLGWRPTRSSLDTIVADALRARTPQ